MDGGQGLIFLPGSEWAVPIYSCITANQALLRTVSFRFNSTDGLSGLAVVDITDKQYLSEDDMPLWGVENIDNTTGLTLADVDPFWGLVSPQLAAAATANFGRTSPALTSPLLPSLRCNPSADTVINIPNLIWTDLAANAVVGTKSLADAPASQRVPVTVYTNRIQYRLSYAIPALLVLAALVLMSLATLCTALFRRTDLGKMRRYLNATAAGRIMTAVLLDEPKEDGGGLMRTAVWVKRGGQALGIEGGNVGVVTANLDWLSKNPSYVLGLDDAQLRRMFGALVDSVKHATTSARRSDRQEIDIDTTEAVALRAPVDPIATTPQLQQCLSQAPASRVHDNQGGETGIGRPAF
ncbi:hypothetical protein VTK56DRAFT_8902 [Thermocarpiscus australiensis]